MGDAIVLFSGGMDSTVALFWAIERFDAVHALSIHYGQRHASELVAASKIAFAAREVLSSHDFVNMPTPPGELTKRGAPIASAKASVVPGRNLLFLALAASRAEAVGAESIVIGACLDDATAYRDCRPHFLRTAEVAMGAGSESAPRISAPFVGMTKRGILGEAARLGCLDAVGMSLSCYEGKRPGCGACPACMARAAGFASAGLADPAVEITQPTPAPPED